MSELPGLGVGTERLRVMCLSFHRVLTQHDSASRPPDPSQLPGLGFWPDCICVMALRVTPNSALVTP